MIFLLRHILVPYRKADRYCLNKQLRELNQELMGFEFMVHVGDLKHGHEPCYESSFLDVAEMFSHVSNALNYDPRNCFFVPGDNEFQDCQNRTKAWGWWMKRKSHLPDEILWTDSGSCLTINSSLLHRFREWRNPEQKWILHVIGSQYHR